MEPKESKPSAMLIRNWANALPTNDLSNMLYWDQKELINIDSPSIISQYKQALSFNQRVFSMLITDPESPYTKYAAEFDQKSTIDFDQWCWAFSTISQRNLVLHN